jgi:hypothetical protein
MVSFIAMFSIMVYFFVVLWLNFLISVVYPMADSFVAWKIIFFAWVIFSHG